MDEEEDLVGVIPRQPYFVPRIPLKQVVEATENFSEKNKLGSGGYGDVYKGVDYDGTIWAVKRSKAVNEKTREDFQNEVKFHFSNALASL